MLPVEDILHLPEGTKVIGKTFTHLTSPGENYGSLILKVDITVETPQGNDIIHAVAKTTPVSKRAQEIFNTATIIPTEINFYKHVVPLLGVDLFPKYLGSRLSPNPILLLENIKLDNYMNLDRLESFDLDVAKLALVNLARFHAVPLRLKIQSREVFDNEVKPLLLPWRMDENFHNTCKTRVDQIISTIPQLQHLKARILAGFDKKLVPHEPREPFATIVHNDYWINNIMVKVENGKPVGCKIVDLQCCTYGSPTKDVLFFLFANVQVEVLDQHYDKLLWLYYESFVSVIGDVKVFSFGKFQEELEFEAKHTQFGHILFMLFVIFAPKDGDDKVEFSIDGLLKMEITELYRKRLVYVVNEFAKRKWI